MILMNDQPKGNIIPHRVLHQGDHLSSFNFIIYTKALVSLLNNAKVHGKITWIVLRFHTFFSLMIAFLIYHRFYPLLAMVYRCFRNYPLCFGVFLTLLQVQGWFGEKWWSGCILEIKWEEARSWLSNHLGSTFRVHRRSMHTLCHRSTAKRAKPSRLKTQVKTYLQKYPWLTFNVIIMCSATFLGNTSFFLSLF